MNATIGHWLFSTLGARESRALRQPDFQPIKGVFDPDKGAVPDLVTSATAFQARYGLPLKDLKGSEIGEGAVPDKPTLEARIHADDNPCLLDNHRNYVVTDVDIVDLRYVARSGRPIWESIRDNPFGAGSGGGGNGDCPQRLQAANAQIDALRAQIGQRDVKIGQLDAEVARLKGLVPVAVPADIDQTVALLKGAGSHLEIGPGVKSRFTRLGRFVDTLKARKP
jgi:hypothetical protein